LEREVILKRFTTPGNLARRPIPRGCYLRLFWKGGAKARHRANKGGGRFLGRWLSPR